MKFCALESCGKCTPCRIGSTRGVEIIDRIRAGANEQIPLLRDLCDTMTYGSMCAMGGMTPYPVLSALNHFPEDFPMNDIDYGTPAVVADRQVTLNIDGVAVSVPAGTSVMRAAVKAGVMIPKLCATDSLKPFGSCRLCLVEIEGRRGYPSSCTTPAEAGMKVRTQSSKLAHCVAM